MKLINWINGVTKLNKATFDEFQNNIKEAIDGIDSSAIELAVLQKVFPIGSRYVTQSDTNPATILNFGTWKRLKGKVCVGLDEDDSNFNEIGKTGGESAHKLTLSELPSKVNLPYGSSGSGNAAISSSAMFTNTSVSGVAAIATGGSDAVHNNLQPYEVVGYMWIRRA